MNNVKSDIVINNSSICSFLFDSYEFSIEYSKEDNLWVAIPYDADKFDYLIHIEGFNVEENRFIGFDNVNGVKLFNNYLLTKEKFEELKSLTI